MSKLKSNSVISHTKFQIRGGIHPQQHKSISSENKIASLTDSRYFILPLKTSNSNQPSAIVQKGDKVKQGQALNLAELNEFTSRVHAPCDGVIENIADYDLGHPSGFAQPALKLIKEICQENPKDKPLTKSDAVAQLSRAQLIEKVHRAGIVGLGGAGFPTHIKLSAPANKVHTLIVNAMECEPYITCDDRLLREESSSVLHGAILAAQIVGAKTILFGIEDNKPQAISALEVAIANYLEDFGTSHESFVLKVVVAKTKYPSGGEKQLIQLLTGEQVPQGKLPISLGLLVLNVATLHAVYKAIAEDQVMTKRLVTITGDLVSKPGNYWINFGTPVSHIIQQLDVETDNLSCFIFGGPLMGERLTNLDIPTRKSTNCIIFDSSSKTLEQPAKHQECIRCGECEVACPVDLLPQQLYWFAKSQQWQALEEHQLFSCIDCAACAYVCPSEIPLVSYYQFAKSEINDLKVKQAKSELAKTRFDNREKRLARIKTEREQKRKKSAEARKLAAANSTDDPDGKKSAIEAALLRVKNKKETKS